MLAAATAFATLSAFAATAPARSATRAPLGPVRSPVFVSYVPVFLTHGTRSLRFFFHRFLSF